MALTPGTGLGPYEITAQIHIDVHGFCAPLSFDEVDCSVPDRDGPFTHPMVAERTTRYLVAQSQERSGVPGLP